MPLRNIILNNRGMNDKPTPYYDHAGITIYHGDCRDILLHLEPVDLVLTDPPYNFEACGGGFYGVKWRGLTSEPREYLSKLKKLDCTEFNPIETLELLPVKYGYFFCNKTLVSKYIRYAEENGLLYDILIMYKTNPIPAKNNHYLHDLEYVVMMRPPSSYFFCDDYNLMSKLHTTTVGNGKVHPAEKPISIISKYLRVSCPKDGTILDPFMGSGTTLVAAKNLGRKAIGIEIEEKYCEIAVNRLRQEVLPL